MKILGSILLVSAVALAVVLGPQTAGWSWGPALIALGVAVAMAGFARMGGRFSSVLLWPLLVAAGWIAWRCATTPILDDARADMLLLAAAMGCAWVVGRMGARAGALRCVVAGLAVVALGNGVMALLQWKDPTVVWPYAVRSVSQPTGFFGHYIDFSCFMGGVGLVVAARLVASRDSWWLKGVYFAAVVMVLVTVPLSQGRAGLLGLGVGGLMLLGGWLVLLWRRRHRAFGVLMVVLPFVVISAVVAIWGGLRGVTTDEINSAELSKVADNHSRLKYFQLAMDVAARHPLTGAGSRAYAWEKNQVFDVDKLGPFRSSEPYVHNEFLQTAAEYGWVGAGLVLVATGVLLMLPLIGLFMGSTAEGVDDAMDPVRLGVLSAGTALLFQANFSFVFHSLPTVMVLGILFGMAGLTGLPERLVKWPWRVVAAAASLMAAAGLISFGQAGARALRTGWAAIYLKGVDPSVTPGWAAAQLAKANALWPGYELGLMRAQALQTAGNRETGGERETWFELAVQAYREVLKIHPYHPEAAINLANTLSLLDKGQEAERAFEQSIVIEGGMESVYQARFWYARHLLLYWDGQWKRRRAEEALWGFQKATQLMEEVGKSVTWDMVGNHRSLRDELGKRVRFLEEAGIQPRPPAGE